MESKEISGSELGALKYVSELLDWDIKRTANLFILILIFVFDPLAITLVIATNQAFKGKRKEDTVHDTAHDTVHDTAHDDVEIPESYLTHHTTHYTPQVPTNYRRSTDEVKKIWERVKKLRKKGLLPLEQTEEENIDEPTALSFTPYEIEDLGETYHVEENNKKRLIYKK
jgi:hypothetical protein